MVAGCDVGLSRRRFGDGRGRGGEGCGFGGKVLWETVRHVEIGLSDRWMGGRGKM